MIFSGDSKISSVLKKTVEILSRAGIARPDFEAEMMLSEILDVNRPQLNLYFEEPLSPEHRNTMKDAMERRCAHEPLQYIFRRAYFRQLRLSVGPGTLIPRPETELMVDMALKQLPLGGKICDAGCGSGAIALSLAHERPDLAVMGIDNSEDALCYARKNKSSYNLSNVEFVQSDLLDGIKESKFDAIAANLPYVTDSEFEKLPDEIRLFEPENALRAGPEGLDLIYRLIDSSGKFLEPGGFIILETGSENAVKTADKLSSAKCFRDCGIHEDYNGFKRFVSARRT